MPNYTTTRPKPALLNQGTKQPLQTKPSAKTLNPSATPASVVLQSSSNPSSSSSSTQLRSPGERNGGMSMNSAGGTARKTQEVDIAGAVQPFLDPAGWDEMKRVWQVRSEGAERDGDEERRKRRQGRKEAEEDERRKREREAEFGGMAVRERMRRR